jgi:hypothetical protein
VVVPQESLQPKSNNCSIVAPDGGLDASNAFQGSKAFTYIWLESLRVQAAGYQFGETSLRVVAGPMVFGRNRTQA